MTVFSISFKTFSCTYMIMETKKKVTILIPCYNEEASLDLLYDRLNRLAQITPPRTVSYDWEFLFVNDGSKDGTMNKIKALRTQDRRVAFVDLSRNFGKEAAMLAGFDHAAGDCVVILDADLQDPPELVLDMLRFWEEGYDDVYAKRVSRGKESWLRRKLTLGYYALLQTISQVDVLKNVGDFRLLDRKCIDALKSLRERERYTKGLFCWIGFHKKEIEFDRGDRAAGTSSFNLWKLTNLAIEGITSFTTAPLRFSTIVGTLISFVALIYMCYILTKTLLWGDPVQGFPTLMVVILFLGGIQLLSLGIIGEYLGRIFYETKNRPVYVVKEYQGE